MSPAFVGHPGPSRDGDLVMTPAFVGHDAVGAGLPASVDLDADASSAALCIDLGARVRLNASAFDASYRHVDHHRPALNHSAPPQGRRRDRRERVSGGEARRANARRGEVW
jgi:hypothetical protein